MKQLWLERWIAHFCGFSKGARSPLAYILWQGFWMGSMQLLMVDDPTDGGKAITIHPKQIIIKI